jgi:hypothetical protein
MKATLSSVLCHRCCPADSRESEFSHVHVLQRKRVDNSSSDTSSEGEAEGTTIKREGVKIKKEKKDPEVSKEKKDKSAAKRAKKHARKPPQPKPMMSQVDPKKEKSTENLLPKWFQEIPASWKVGIPLYCFWDAHLHTSKPLKCLDKV